MNDKHLCARLMNQVALSGPKGLSEDLRRHSVSCGSCRRRLLALEALTRSVPEDGLYTASLRAATLRAVDARSAVPGMSPYAFLLIPAALILNIFLSIVLPAGLFQQVLPGAMGRTPAGMVVSLSATAALGTLSVLICVLSMHSAKLKEVFHA